MRVLLLLACLAPAALAGTPQWGVWEERFTAKAEGSTLRVQAHIIRPDAGIFEVSAFWDGGREWVIRWTPDVPGKWGYELLSSDPDLNGKEGTFEVDPAPGRGMLQLSKDRRRLEYEDGAPFFWLADTAWNGAIRSTDEEWARYIADRKAKGFTAVQFVMTQWRAAPDAGAFTAGPPLQVNPEFFRRLDRRFAALYEAGLVAVPVLLWAIGSTDGPDPGFSLPTDEAVHLARYMVARYSAYRVVWMLGGDGDYRGEKAEKWKQIGREVFPPLAFRRAVTMHPQGMQWPWEAFENERWLDLLTYQSGHGNNAKSRAWNAVEAGKLAASLAIPRPVINAEPNYETHLDYHDRKPISDFQVRRAAYWSLLAHPTAGITYGAHGIWFWSRKPEVPTAHDRTGVAMPWWESLDLPGARQMKILREVFDSIPWWQLEPDPDLVAERPDDPAFLRYAGAARTTPGDVALLYLPDNPEVMVRLERLKAPVQVQWIDPRTGRRQDGDRLPNKGVQKFERPAEGDWLLLLDGRTTAFRP